MSADVLNWRGPDRDLRNELMNRADVQEALAVAVEIVDDVMPWDWPVRATRSAQDRTELRKVALRAVFNALLAGSYEQPEPEDENKPEPDEEPGEADELIKPATAATILDVPGVKLREWADRGILSTKRTPTGYRLYNRKEVEALRDMPAAERVKLTEYRNDAGIEEIARLRDEEHLGWGEISRRTGTHPVTISQRYGKWKRAQRGQPPAEPKPADAFEVRFSSPETW
jgi:hypothetical protein